VILVDVNLLLYAVNSDLERHEAARRWWQETLSGTEPVGLPWVVVLAFVRLTTHPRVFERPLEVDQAVAYVDEWLAQPVADVVAPGANHWPILRNLLEATGSAGNLVTDAHIAALALEQGYAVYSADNDFRRFPGLKHVNPLG
jgi:hypothetical protein